MKRRLAYWCAAATVACTTAAVSLPIETGASVLPRTLASESPQQILASARAATTAQKRFVGSCSTAIPSAGISGATSTHVAEADGWQGGTVKVKGNSTTARAQIRFLDGVVYLEGNALYLEFEFNVKTTKFAGKWISIKKGQLDYASISSGLSMSSALVQLTPVGKLAKSGVATFAGKSVIAVHGKTSPAMDVGTGTAVLYVGTAKPFLPVGLVVHTTVSGHALRGTCTFGQWKSVVTVFKPPSSTPITKTGL